MTTTGTATDIREGQVIKEGRTFFVTDRFGDVPPGNTAALGLYHQDTRFLSELTLEVEDVPPLLLHSSTERNYWQIVELAYPFPEPEASDGLDNVSVQRSRLLSDQLFEHIRIRNFGSRARSLRLTIRFGADFLDIFEVRGLLPDRRRGQLQTAQVERNRVILGYRGLDGETRTTTLRFSPAPSELSEGHATFDCDAGPGGDVELSLEVIPEVGRRSEPRRSMRDAEQRLEQEYTAWRKRCTRFRADNVQLQRFLDRAVLDLRMLSFRDDRGAEYVDAGIPWYSALFGRDALITAYQALGVIPDLAWSTLRGLARRQGTEVDEWREEEPGKILHELRVGEAARAGEIPHTPYYGSIDATPLWISVLHGAFRWTGDVDAVRELWPNVLEALRLDRRVR